MVALSEPRIINGMDLPRKSEADQRAFFDAVMERAVKAEAVAGQREVDLELAGSVIRLSFAGGRLFETLLPPLDHLRIAASRVPDAVVHVWESAESGVPMVAAPCEPGCFTPRGDIWTMMSRRVRSSFHSVESSLNLFDLDRRQAICWTRSVAHLPFWVRAAPLRTILHWWLEELGGQLLHGAAVGTESGGTFITGKGGVGKSTTSMSCLRAGFRFAGDDYVAITLDPVPTAHSLYRTAKIDRATLGRFAEFKPVFYGPGEDEKGVILLDADHPSLVRSLTLDTVLTPALSDHPETEVVTCNRDRLRTAASTTTLSQLPHAGQHVMDFIERLLDRLPGGLLRLGTDLDGVPPALERFIAAPIATPVDTGTSGAAPLVSVIIPVFNGADFLAEAVSSVIAQDYANIEIVIVDDGSTDAIDDAVNELGVAVRFVKQGNQGPAAARNTGIRSASGEYIAFLDVDDLWPSGRLDAAMAVFAQSATLDVVTGWGQLMSFDEMLQDWVFVDDASLGFSHYISAAVFRRSVFETLGLFDEELRFSEDMDWFMRAEEAGLAVERLDRSTLLVRRHAKNSTFGRHWSELTPVQLFRNALNRHRTRLSDDRLGRGDQDPTDSG